MTGDRYVLAVDLGTGGPKVGLVSTRGGIEWWEHHTVTTTYGDHGSATQDADEWWSLVQETSRRGLEESGIAPEAVVAAGVTGQWASTVPVDDAGEPVGPCLLWTDTQGARHSHAVVGGPVQGYDPRRLATWVRRTGGVPSTSGADPIGHMLHLRHDRPEIARRARWYLEPVDYLTMRLTGVPAASHMSMTASWLTDNRRLDVLDYDRKLVAMAGVEAEKLPPLVPSGSVVGPVQPSTAGALGLGHDVQVITGMPDLHAVTIGSGLVLEGEAHASIGTSAWISCPLPRKKTDVVRQVATVPGLGTSLGAAPYLMGNSQDSAGRCLQWFRDQVAAGTHGARPGFDTITALAAEAPPGANGVLFTPWLTGERSPVDDRAARGGFHNVAIASTQADLARAVLEGVALNLRWLLAASERFAKETFDPLRLVGGGAQSALWCQIVADVCDRTVERVADPLLTGLRGVGIAAGLALGEIALADVRSLVPVDRTFAPDPAHRATYDRAFAELPRLYRAQRGMSARLDG